MNLQLHDSFKWVGDNLIPSDALVRELDLLMERAWKGEMSDLEVRAITALSIADHNDLWKCIVIASWFLLHGAVTKRNVFGSSRQILKIVEWSRLIQQMAWRSDEDFDIEGAIESVCSSRDEVAFLMKQLKILRNA